MVLGLALAFFLPGAAICGMLGIDPDRDPIRWSVHSFFLSYVTVGFLSMLTVPLPFAVRWPVIYGCLAVLGMFSALEVLKGRLPLDIRLRWSPEPVRLSWKHDWVVLVILVVYHVALTVTAYPDLGYMASSDWGRHYAYANVLMRAPELYDGFYPPFLRAHMSAILRLTDCSVGAVATSLALTSFMFPIALYYFGALFFEPSRGRLKLAPIVLTLLGEFTVRSGGFKWLGRLAKGVPVFPRGFWFQSGLFYGPQHMGVALLIFSLALIWERWDEEAALSKIKLLVLGSTISSLHMTHMIEATVLGVAAPAWYVISARTGECVKLRDLVKATVLGFSLSAVLHAWFRLWNPFFELGFMHLVSLGVPLALSTLALAVGERFEVNEILSSAWGRILQLMRSNRGKVALALLLIYSLSLLTWVDLWGEEVVYVRKSGQIVLFYETVVTLGVPGLLAAFGFYGIISSGEEWLARLRDRVLFLIGLGIVCLLMGDLIGISLQLGRVVGFAEIRMVRLARLVLVPAGVVGLTWLAHRILGGREKSIRARKLAVVVVAALLIANEAIPTVAGSIQWAVGREPHSYGEGEIAAMRVLREIFLSDRRAYAFSTQRKGSFLLALGGAPFERVPNRQVVNVVSQRTAEASILMAFAPAPADHPYLLHPALEEWSFFGRMAEKLRPIYENSDVSIYDLPKFWPVLERSSVTLAVPVSGALDASGFSSQLICALSHLHLNFTTALDLDPGILRSKILLLPYDPPTVRWLEKRLSAEPQDIERWSPRFGFRVPIGPTENPIMRSLSPRVTAAVSPLPPPLEGKMSLIITPLGRTSFLNAVYGIVFSYSDRIGILRAAVVEFKGDGGLRAGVLTYSLPSGEVDTSFVSLQGWEEGGTLNLTVRLEEDGGVRIFLDGVEVSKAIREPSTKVGVLWTPLTRSHFAFRFSVYEKSLTDWGPHLDRRSLLEYVEGGGTLVIFNSNGYHAFSTEFLGTSTGDRVSCSSLSGEPSLELPFQVNVEIMEDPADSCEVRSAYEVGDVRVPFVCSAKMGEGRVYLVNVRPIVEYLSSGELSRRELEALYGLLGEALLSDQLVERSQREFTKYEYDLVSGLKAERAEVSSRSLMVRVKEGVAATVLNSEGVALLRVQGPTFIGLSSDEIRLELSDLELSSYREEDIPAFYAALKVTSPSLNLTSTNSLRAVYWTEDQINGRVLPGGRYVILLEGDENVTAYALTPTVRASGSIEFLGIFGLDFVPYRPPACTGRDVVLNGSADFHISMSDDWLFLSDVAASGEWDIRPALFEVEWSVVLHAVLKVLAFLGSLAAVGSLALHLYYRKKRA